jgi:leucyl-tRNA synthetase
MLAALAPDRPMAEPYYITTAIGYPNGPPHIGHAYEAIATDAIGPLPPPVWAAMSSS